jgi:hypothetical protein
VPLALIAGALPIGQALRQSTRAAAAQSAVLFAVGPVIASLAVAALNMYWYGSPTESGYGNIAGRLYRWDFLPENIVRYPVWLWQSQPWTVIAAAAGVIALWRHRPNVRPGRTAAAACALFALGVVVSYAFYLPLEDWWTLRFLFPAFPLLCIVAACGAMTLPATPWLFRAAAVVLAAALAVGEARERGAFDTSAELRYEAIGRYIADQLPRNAVLLSMLHSGSANFYSGRLTIRWDWLMPEQLDPLIADLRRRGYVPFLLLDETEEQPFSSRFNGASRLAPLDWAPLLTMPHVKIFDTSPASGAAPGT